MHGPNDLRVEEVGHLPPLGKYQCLCRNLYGSACTGTDRKLLSDCIPWGAVTYPSVLGHETVGELVEVGSKVKNFREGDIVLRPVYGYPGEQVNGLYNEFGGFSELGIITDYKAMLEDGLGAQDYNPYAVYQMKLPRDWKDRPESVLFITMKETFSWIHRLGPLYGKKVGVIGAGPVGMFFMRFASLLLASEIVAFARGTSGKARSLNCGADRFIAIGEEACPERDFDLLIDAAGLGDGINSYLPWLRPGGTLGVYGVGDSMESRIRGFGSNVFIAFHSPDEADPLVHQTCLGLVEKGIMNLGRFHSSLFPMEKIPEAFAKIDAKEEFKPLFKF